MKAEPCELLAEVNNWPEKGRPLGLELLPVGDALFLRAVQKGASELGCQG